jgi:monoamine oxidase
MAKTPLFAWLKQMTGKALAENKTYEIKVLSRVPERGMSRREFLKTLSGGALTLGLLPWAFSEKAQSVSPRLKTQKLDMEKPVIIVGAGLAGLVTAYRLMLQGVPCQIFEASHRVGGRMFTRNHFNDDAMFVELGGELVDTGHEAIIALCDELGLSLQTFEKPEPGIEPCLFVSEGLVKTEAAVIQAFKPLAKALADDLIRIFPDGEVEVPTYQKTFGAEWLDNQSLESYLESKRDVPGWLIKVIKAAYTGEYGLDTSEQSALNLLLLIGADTDNGFRMFGESDEAMRITGGSERLPQALYKAIAGKVPIHFGAKLKLLQNTRDSLILTFTHGLKPVEVQAEQAVLAIPFSVLRSVEGLDDLGLPARKLKAIREWGYGTNSKQMMGFKSRFWQTQDPAYMPNAGELFTDWPSQCYWETSRLQVGNGGILTNFLGGKAGLNADHQQWKQALQDLDTLYHGKASEQFSGDRAFMHWPGNALAQGSYTCPRPGQYTTLVGVAGEPELEGRLLFAGEHCSVDWAGFMNGAAESGLLAAHFIVGQRSGLEVQRIFG